MHTQLNYNYGLFFLIYYRHPEKVKNDYGAEKFIQIKLAYEILADLDRRRIFDRYGVSDINSQYFQKKHDYSEYNRFTLNQNDDDFGQRFDIKQDIAFYQKLSITENYFEKMILSKNAKKCTSSCFTMIGVLNVLELLMPSKRFLNYFSQ